MTYSKFSIDRKELKDTLNVFKKLLKRKFDSTICTLKIIPGGIELSTPGIMRTIYCETEGQQEFLVPVKLLYAYSSTSANKTMNFILYEGKMECDKSIYSSPKIKIIN